MKRTSIVYSTSLALTAIFLVVGLSGILIFPGFLQFFGVNINSLPKVQMHRIHHWLGLLLMIVVSIHINLHWKWLVGITKGYFQRVNNIKMKSFRKKTNFLVSLSLITPYFLVILTGIIKFPGFLPFLGISPISIPFYEISIIHDWSGIIVITLTFVHLAMHTKWLVAKTKLIISSIRSRHDFI